MWCVILQPKGTTRNAMLPAGAKTLTAEAVGAILRRATAPECIGTWAHDGTGTVHLYGYKTGKTGTENKHEVLPPYDTVPLFGEALVFAMKDGVLVSFNTAEYTKFYNSTLREREDDDDSGSESGEEDGEGEAEEEGDEDAGAEEEDDASSDESASDDGGSLDADECEEEENVPAPIPVPVLITKPKRISKKAQSLYTIQELVPVEYGTGKDPHPRSPLQQMALNVLKQKCEGTLSADEIDDFERGIFNATLQDSKHRLLRCVWENPEFQTMYEITAKRAISNVDGHSYIGNARLLIRLREGEFAPHDIPFMTYSDLYPEKWHTLSEAAMKREAKMLEVDKSMATDMFRCSRCGKRQCTYYEMQTRSADEPMTQFIRCLNCGKQWRQ